MNHNGVKMYWINHYIPGVVPKGTTFSFDSADEMIGSNALYLSSTNI